jgi:hypothetical protein
MARLTPAERRYFARLTGTNTILTLNSSMASIRELFVSAGITTEAVKVVFFDAGASQDILELELKTSRSSSKKRLIYKD